MSDKYAVNTEVEWEWGSGTGQGKVRKVFTERVSRTIKGSEITRNATEDGPAYLIEQDDLVAPQEGKCPRRVVEQAS